MRRKLGFRLRAGQEPEAPRERGPALPPGDRHWVPFRLPEPPRPPKPSRRSERPARVHPSFQRMVTDETLRTELGPDVVAALVLENLDLSTRASSEGVRRFIIEHRAG